MTDEQAIRNLVATWMEASKNNDLPTLLGLMSDDMIFHTCGRPPFGKKEFEADSKGAQGSFTMDGGADVEELRVDGNLAYARTHIHFTITPAGGAPSNFAGYALSVFEKRGGKWLLFRDANFVGKQV